jgi:hypothetical protein
MSISIQGQVGPRVVADGGSTEFRQSRMSALVTVPCHATYAETNSRGAMFTIATAAAGTTVVAANNAPPAAAGATILSLHNPIGSTVNAILCKTVIGNVSGTPGAGAFTYCVAWGARVTAAQNAVPRCNLLSGRNPVCYGYTQTALTTGTVHTVLRPIGIASFAGAIAATTTELAVVENVDGEIVIPPGGILTIASAATGTTHIVYASMTWEEMPV